MIRKENFILGDNISTRIYSYDDQGTEYSREIKGKICQITNDFVVIDNGKYKESFKYSEFERCTPGNIENEPYDLSLETYKEDIIQNCIDDITKKGSGFVFTKEEADKVIEYIETINVENNKYIVNQKDGIYEISKI